MRGYFSPANMAAGFIGMMVGFTSSVALVFQAAITAGASEAEIASWLFGLGFSIAITCIVLSLRYRMPILTGWSTPGAALLITSLSGFSMPEAIGAFIIAALLTIIAGVTGIFERVMRFIPKPLASAMLAGILLNFGIDIFSAMEKQFSIIMAMLTAYFIIKKISPRYVILLVLTLGVVMAKLQGLLHFNDIHFSFTLPVFTQPVFTLSSVISIALPLFIVTMTSQNLPGVAVLNANNYHPRVSPLISFIGLITLIFSSFGCYAINLAAITAAICASNEADSNPANRYKATIFAGICWIGVGLFGATIVTLFSVFPRELIMAIAGLALLSTIANSLKSSLDDETYREPALVTILVCASGVSLCGIGSAFWGLLAGILCSSILHLTSMRLSFIAKSKAHNELKA